MWIKIHTQGHGSRARPAQVPVRQDGPSHGNSESMCCHTVAALTHYFCRVARAPCSATYLPCCASPTTHLSVRLLIFIAQQPEPACLKLGHAWGCCTLAGCT